MDFDGDGHIDILTATFAGSPYLMRGSKEGYSEAEVLRDAQGERILIASFWNYESRKHESTGRALGTKKAPSERCISALAFDWDGDGDHDLLLGSYEKGHLYRQMNEGTNAKPAFTGKNIPVMAGDVRFAISEKMTAPRLVDWDGDGDQDLIAGSFGGGYRGKLGGAVYLCLNQGKPGAPRFGPLEVLIPRSEKGQSEPTRPDGGLYVDATDYDGDGDLDLVVGGYSLWSSKPSTSTKQRDADLSELRAELAAANEASRQLLEEAQAELAAATEGLDPDGAEATRITEAISKRIRAEHEKSSRRVEELTRAIRKLQARPQRKPFVWLYERQ